MVCSLIASRPDYYFFGIISDAIKRKGSLDIRLSLVSNDPVKPNGYHEVREEVLLAGEWPYDKLADLVGLQVREKGGVCELLTPTKENA